MKKKILVRGPALSRSGYGEQTRFALRALKAHEDKFDIFLFTTNWGSTSWITEDDAERQWIDGLLEKTIAYKHQGDAGFDVSLQVTIPGEWEKLAPTNIGYTAGVESTKVSVQWLEKTFLMNKIIVPSNHTKSVFESTTWPAKNQDGEILQVGCQTPVEVVAFPAKETEVQDVELNLETDFNFLAVAQLSPRKNFVNTVRWFVEEFHDEEVGLVVKVSLAKNSLIDRNATRNNLRHFLSDYPDRKCKVYLLHGTLSEGEMNSLYTNEKIKAIVTTTHGEGFGLPLFEAAQQGLPVVAPAWSGHKDFLYAPIKNKKTKKTKKRSLFTKVDYELRAVQPEAVWADIIIADSMWCYPKKGSFTMALRKVYKEHGYAVSQAKKLQTHILKTYTPEKQYDLFVQSLGLDFSEVVDVDVKEWFDQINKNVETHA